MTESKHNIQIDFTPWPHQRVVLSCQSRNQVWLFHRRAGKTMAAVHLIVQELLSRPERGGMNRPRGYYIAPELKQARDIAWKALLYASKPFEKLPGYKIDNQNLYVEILGRKIQLLGATKLERLVGVYSDITILDEAQHLSPAILNAIVPTLSDYNGRLIIDGTPMGVNHFKKWYDDAHNDTTGEWAAFTYTARDTNALSAKELKSARNTLGDDAFQQEYNCSWNAAIKGSIWGKWMQAARDEGRIFGKDIFNPELPVYTAWDIGFTDSTAIWFFQLSDNKVHFIDCYANSGEELSHYIKVCKERPYVIEKSFVPHDIRQHELISGKSRLDVMKAMGMKPEVVESMKVKDGIELVRRNLFKCYFGSKCSGLPIDSLSLYRYKYNPHDQIYSQTPLHDLYSHYADSFRYALVGVDGLRSAVMDYRSLHPMDKVATHSPDAGYFKGMYA